MNRRFTSVRVVERVLLAALVAWGCVGIPSQMKAGDYGRLTGTVSDTEGSPLMGATVLLAGPQLSATQALGTIVERVSTDAHGRFTVEHLAPGWYSLRVLSPTRMPAMRDKVRVAAGETTHQKFVLGDIFSAFHLQRVEPNFSTWSGEWKWILRTSESTRPVLRYQKAEQASNNELKRPLPASQHMIGVLPGSMHQDSLSQDPGMGSFVAYLRPLNQDSDLLVAGSLATTGLQGSSLVTAVRKNLVKGDPQEISLAVHQLNLDDGVPIAVPGDHGRLATSRGMVLSYDRTRRISGSLTLTTGFEVDYLNSIGDAAIFRPRLEISCRMNHATLVAFRYGPPRADAPGTLLDRVGELSEFPRVTMRGSHPALENAQHAEIAIQHNLGSKARLEIAAYRDAFQNAAVWGFGDSGGWMGLERNFLPNPGGHGVVLNAGHYHASGFRAGYDRRLGEYSEVTVAYFLGDALAPVRVASSSLEDSVLDVAEIASHLRPFRSQSISGRFSTRIPFSHTQVITSYTWLPKGRVTGVDPYGLARMELQPYLVVQIRQPLPAVAFLPAHIEALADFRNLLGQGAVPLGESGGKPVVLASAYRTLRGGFSVQF